MVALRCRLSGRDGTGHCLTKQFARLSHCTCGVESAPMSHQLSTRSLFRQLLLRCPNFLRPCRSPDATLPPPSLESYAPSLRQPARRGGYAASRAADFTVAANWRLSRSTSCASAPSTITRMTGSVPEARNNTRPWSASSFSASRTARITWLD